MRTVSSGDYPANATEPAGPLAVLSGVASDPWSWSRHVPVSRIDAITEDGMLTDIADMVEVPRRDELLPARNVIPGSVFGWSWCDLVPADPHILFYGEDGALAARLWTHGRTLLHGRVPWYTASRGSDRSSDRQASHHPEWTDRYAAGLRRAKALLTGAALDEGDAAGIDLDCYGLGKERTLDEWIEYSGLDYAARRVRTPWP